MFHFIILLTKGVLLNIHLHGVHLPISDSLKLEQEKSRRFLDKIRSSDDNNVENAKQAGVNLKHDYSNQVEKIQHELDLKRHAEEAALQVELNQMRHFDLSIDF